jgi:hypothetical protein
MLTHVMGSASLVLLGGVLALAEDVSVRVLTGPEADSNARREVSGQVPRPDVLWRGQMSGSVMRRERKARVLLETHLGAKAFLREDTENLSVAESRFRADVQWLNMLSTFVDVSGRDRRQLSYARSYTTANADAGLVLGPLGPFQVVAGLGPRTFVFWPDSAFSFVGAGTYAAVTWRPTAAEALSVQAGMDGRLFPRGSPVSSFDDAGTPTFNSTQRRADGSGWTDVSLESTRALYFKLSWRLAGNGSNSRPERFVRQRVAVTGGAQLPGGLRVLVEGHLQATRWPYGLGLGERLVLQEGDESQTNLVAQFSIPLLGGLWLEGRTAAYAAEFSSARTPFLRLTGFLGLGWRL